MINSLNKNTIQNTTQKTTQKTIQDNADIGKYMLEKLNCSKREMSDEDKQKMVEKIQSKLKRGKKLTVKELRYLRENNPALYRHAMRVQMHAKMVEEQLKHAKSKEEVHRIISGAISCVSDKDPDKEYILAAINELSKEMHKSPFYNRLPATIEETRNKAEQKENKIEWDDEEDNNDLMNWSPLQEIIDTMPTFCAGV